MTFTILPLTGQTLGNTRDAIRTNFSLLQTTISENHGDMNSAVAGKHTVIDIVDRGVATDPTTQAGETALYSKTGVSGNLFLRSPSNSVGTQGVYQLTTFNDTSQTLFGTYTNYIAPVTTKGGWTFLPGGLILQYGSFVAAGDTTVTYPFAFPSGPPFMINITAQDSANPVVPIAVATSPSLPTAVQFTVRAGAGAKTINWTAIGK